MVAALRDPVTSTRNLKDRGRFENKEKKKKKKKIDKVFIRQRH